MDGVIGRRSTVTRWLVKLSGVLPILLVALTVISPASAAEEHPIAVIYPDIGEPYRQIFTEIISGIEDKLGAPVASYAVNADTNISVLKTSLNLENTKVVIALGRQGMQAAKQLNNRIKVVVGGVLTVPENDSDDQPVISLTPDPALLFARMKALMPSMKRVFVVYDPSFDTWLMKLAEACRECPGSGTGVVQGEESAQGVRILPANLLAGRQPQRCAVVAAGSHHGGGKFDSSFGAAGFVE